MLHASDACCNMLPYLREGVTCREGCICPCMQGADVSFQIRGGAGASVAPDALLTVYTTRPDTVRGHPHTPLKLRFMHAARPAYT